jgi:hypothetical protein
MAQRNPRIIWNYHNQRESYLQNALKFHQAGRIRKSSELFFSTLYSNSSYKPSDDNVI